MWGGEQQKETNAARPHMAIAAAVVVDVRKAPAMRRDYPMLPQSDPKPPPQPEAFGRTMMARALSLKTLTMNSKSPRSRTAPSVVERRSASSIRHSRASFEYGPSPSVPTRSVEHRRESGDGFWPANLQRRPRAAHAIRQARRLARRELGSSGPTGSYSGRRTGIGES